MPEVLAQVLELTNAERRRHGLPKLRWNDKLAHAAHAHAIDMDRRNYMAHDTPGGPTWWRRIKSWLPGNRALGENVARGFATPAVVVDAWMNSPLHRKNILDRKFRKLGVGYSAPDGCWVQDFAS